MPGTTTPGPDDGDPAGERPAAEATAAELALLGSEQAFLLSFRALTYSESASRLSGFFTSLGAATVTLGLIAGAVGFTDGFLGTAVVLLLVVGFLGLTCFERLLQLNNDDIKVIVALNRVRHAHRLLAPGFGMYQSGSIHDDEAGMEATLALGVGDPAVGGSPLLHSLVTSPTTVGTVNSVLAAMICAAFLLLLHAEPVVAMLGGVVGFLLAFAWHARRQWASWQGLRRNARPRFPTPPAD